MASNTPLISVVMPVRNMARYLAPSVDSVLKQTFTDFELIAIDDGSTDETGAMLAEFARRDPRVRIVPGPGQGISKALNIGLASARGSLIARMDGDDICLPQRFAKQAKFMAEHPECVLVGGQCMLIDPQGRPICRKSGIELSHERIDARLLLMKWPIVHPAVMMRASAVARVGGYNEAYRSVEDHDLFLKLAEVGQLANLDEMLLLYRQHFKSIVHTSAMAQTRSLVEIVTAACGRRGIATPDSVRNRVPEVVSEIEHRRKWVWWALAAGHTRTARHHALAVLRGAPLSRESWMATFCAVRGY